MTDFLTADLLFLAGLTCLFICLAIIVTKVTGEWKDGPYE